MELSRPTLVLAVRLILIGSVYIYICEKSIDPFRELIGQYTKTQKFR